MGFFTDVGRTGALQESVQGILNQRQQKTENIRAEQQIGIQKQQTAIMKSEEGRKVVQEQERVEYMNGLVSIDSIMRKAPGLAGKKARARLLGLFGKDNILESGGLEFVRRKHLKGGLELIGQQHTISNALLQDSTDDYNARNVAIQEQLDGTAETTAVKGKDREALEKEKLANEEGIKANTEALMKSDIAHQKKLDEDRVAQEGQLPVPGFKEKEDIKHEHKKELEYLKAQLRDDPDKAKMGILRLLDSVQNNINWAMANNFDKNVDPSTIASESKAIASELKSMLVEAEIPGIGELTNEVMAKEPQTHQEFIKAILETERGYTYAEASDLATVIIGMING